MNADFWDAYHRHWEDAEYLRAASRWANADHLYGMAAECGLKRLMRAFGMKVNVQGSPKERDDRVHANQVWDRFETYRSRHTDCDVLGSNRFADWRAEQRYAPQHLFTETVVLQHREGAEEVRRLIRQADIQGWLA